MKRWSFFSVAFALAACNETSSIGRGTLDGGSGQSSTAEPDAGPPPSDSGGAPSSAGPSEPSLTPECTSRITASEANNYELVPTFGFDVTHVAPNAVLTFDWSAVTQDFFGHPLDPQSDITHVDIELVNHKGTIDLLAPEFITLSRLTLDLFGLDTLGTRVHAVTTDFTATVAPPPPEDDLYYFDYTPFGGFPYLFSIASTSARGNVTRMFAPFILDFDTQNTNVVMTSQSTTLAYATSFMGLSPTYVAAGDPNLTLDVSHLAVDAFGGAFPEKMSEVRISEQSLSLDDLAQNIMDLDSVADHVWRAPLGTATSIDLSAPVDDAGAPFPGIDTSDHTWLVSVYASDVIPAPVFIALLVPCTPAF